MKLTEEEVKELLENVIQKGMPNNIDVETTINHWKYDLGWIKKTKLEEFEEFYEDIKRTYGNDCFLGDVDKLHDLAKEVISELQDKLKEKEFRTGDTKIKDYTKQGKEMFKLKEKE